MAKSGFLRAATFACEEIVGYVAANSSMCQASRVHHVLSVIFDPPIVESQPNRKRMNDPFIPVEHQCGRNEKPEAAQPGILSDDENRIYLD